jgi:hypothetical protein
MAAARRERDGRSVKETVGVKVVIGRHDDLPHGGKLTPDDLAETSEIGDWKIPDFRAACSYAASQGWLIARDDVLTLTTAGLGAA